MQDQPTTTPAAPATTPSAPTPPPPSTAPADAPADATATPADAGLTTQKVEDELREKGQKLEAAAKDLGHQIDQKLATNQTAQEVKQKVGGLWGKVKEKIK